MLTSIEERHGVFQNSGKLDGIHVDFWRRRQNLTEVSSAPSIKIVRNEIFTNTIYKGGMRSDLVRNAFDYLVGHGNNKFFQEGDEALEVVSQDDGARVAEHMYAPARHGRPVNIHRLDQPYSQFLPLFFPSCTGDVDDPDRGTEISEADWAIHILRLVKKNLVELPLFVFIAAFRLDTAKIVGAYHNAVGYTRTEAGQIEQCEGFEFRQTLRGSKEYFAKAMNDIAVKCDVIGSPQIFFTFSNNSRWDVTLSTALSQDSYNVWHKRDEQNMLTLLQGFVLPDDLAEKYYVHIGDEDERYMGNIPQDQCMYHPNCSRVPMSRLLEGMDVDQLIARNSYNVQREFEQRVREVVNHILLSEGNGVGVKMYHTVKEFTPGCPSGHVHGVAWLPCDDKDATFQKLHTLEAVTEAEKESIVRLADSVISTSLSVERLCHDFVQLSPERASKIVELAARHQQHVCGERVDCQMMKMTDGCGKHFPRLPSDWTILTSPPSDEALPTLVEQCMKVKMNVRQVLTDLHQNGRLEETALVDVLQLALGDPTEDIDDEGVSWGFGQFPLCETLQNWKEKFRSDGSDHVLLLSLYYTALSTSTWRVGDELVYQLLVKRNVAESFTVDYNPFILEVLGSNMELSLITFTPGNVVEYITKEKDFAFSLNEARNNLIENEEAPSLENVLKSINDDRMLSLAEAFYRVDSSLSLTETNLPVLYVDADLPHKRKRFFRKCIDGPDVLPGRHGHFREVPDLFHDYLANK